VISIRHLGLSPAGSMLPGDADAASARPSRPPVETTLPEMERQALVNALEANEGNITQAARDLGISRDTLRYRIEKYGLEVRARTAFRNTH
jgi:two-component system, NtrC family, response regulator AtoC